MDFRASTRGAREDHGEISGTSRAGQEPCEEPEPPLDPESSSVVGTTPSRLGEGPPEEPESDDDESPEDEDPEPPLDPEPPEDPEEPEPDDEDSGPPEVDGAAATVPTTVSAASSEP
jgi:hypothetical protein